MNKRVGGKKSLDQLPIVHHPMQKNDSGRRNGKGKPCTQGHKPNYNDNVAVPGK